MDARALARSPRFALSARLSSRTLIGYAGALLVAITSLFATHVADASAKRRTDTLERRVVRLVNLNRANAGLRPLRLSRTLARSADAHSRDMARRGFFAHASSNGSSFRVRLRRFSNARRLGENLAYVPARSRATAARQIVSMWMNSPIHREVILSPSFRRIGVARRTGHLGSLRATVFTADFASRR